MLLRPVPVPFLFESASRLSRPRAPRRGPRGEEAPESKIGMYLIWSSKNKTGSPPPEKCAHAVRVCFNRSHHTSGSAENTCARHIRLSPPTAQPQAVPSYRTGGPRAQREQAVAAGRRECWEAGSRQARYCKAHASCWTGFECACSAGAGAAAPAVPRIVPSVGALGSTSPMIFSTWSGQA